MPDDVLARAAKMRDHLAAAHVQGRYVRPSIEDAATIASLINKVERLRDRHKPKTSQRLAGVLVCAGCNIYWPCPDAKLIYPKDELKEQP